MFSYADMFKPFRSTSQDGHQSKNYLIWTLVSFTDVRLYLSHKS